MFIWVALKEIARSARILWIITWICLNPGCHLEVQKKSETKATVKPETNTVSSWSYDMEGHAKKCVERYCELANKTTQQFYKVATPCLNDHHFKDEENRSVGELSTVCSQIVLKCLYVARIG